MGVPFDFQAFISAYPEFNVPPTVLTPERGQSLFTRAGLYFDNGPAAPAKWRITPEMQTEIMYLLTAHLAQLSIGSNGQPASGLVGRIASAAEGSVNVSLDFPATPNNAWYLQTQYGAEFWTATAAFRTMHYRPKAGRFGNGLGPGTPPTRLT